MAEIILRNVQINGLTERIIKQYNLVNTYFEPSSLQSIIPINLEINQGIFSLKSQVISPFEITLIQQEDQLFISCNCNSDNQILCEHQTQTLVAILRRDELRIFFDPTLRKEKLREVAADYGLQNENRSR